MKKFPRLLIWLVFSAAPFFPAHAEPYFPPETIALEILTPPPAEDSAERKQEIAGMIALQQHVDEKELADARNESAVSAEMLGMEIGSRKDYPALYHLLDQVLETTRATTNRAKSHWNVERPYNREPKITALVYKPANASYPSGHTSSAFTMAHTMALVLPEKRTKFIARAEAIARHRVLAGVHYPSDLTSGKELALVMMGALLQKDAFQKDIAAAKHELTATRP